MGIWELLLIGIGLSMDAFAVAICKGLSVTEIRIKHVLSVGIYFGGFQALMPLLGYVLGAAFKTAITSIDHWIAFILLGMIGWNMIRESREKEENCESCNSSFAVKVMIPLALATSIDALAVGITFAFLQVHIGMAVVIIGCTTFLLSVIGFKIGNVFGTKYKSKAELTGGIILIIMGFKILVEHLGLF